MLIASSAAPAWAQNDPPPDLHMLLNLDLFKPNPSAAAQNKGGGGDGSMLDQIQTLNALGYLGHGGPAPANSDAPPPPRNYGPSPASGDSETQ
ncbi:MAG: hypothetical protein ACYDC3_20645 [Candidatus Binataceae bacterium]